MADFETYYATYCRLDTQSGSSQVLVDGNIVVVGSELSYTAQTHVTDRGKEVERIVLSRGDQALGFLPEDVFKQVKRRLDAGFVLRAFASAAAFVKRDDSYWAEAAIFCYDPAEAAAFDRFIASTVKRIAKGDHPQIDLSAKEIQHVVESQGDWSKNPSQKLPKLSRGSAYYKTRRTMTESLALAAADGNKGCYVGLFAVVFCIIFSIVWFIFLR